MKTRSALLCSIKFTFLPLAQCLGTRQLLQQKYISIRLKHHNHVKVPAAKNCVVLLLVNAMNAAVQICLYALMWETMIPR